MQTLIYKSVFIHMYIYVVFGSFQMYISFYTKHIKL